MSRFAATVRASTCGFIAWTLHEREQGNYVCYGVVPAGMTTAIGCSSCARSSRIRSCEWGFALGSQFWGTGLFVEARARS